jgi:hypothetical protein
MQLRAIKMYGMHPSRCSRSKSEICKGYVRDAFRSCAASAREISKTRSLPAAHGKVERIEAEYAPASGARWAGHHETQPKSMGRMGATWCEA